MNKQTRVFYKTAGVFIFLFTILSFGRTQGLATKEKYKEIKTELKQILKDDQKYRRLADKVYENPGKYKELNPDSLMKLQGVLDSLNMLKILRLIEECNCLNKDSLGKSASLGAISIVFLHNPFKMHDPQISNVIKKEIKNGYLNGAGYASAFDRVLFNQHKALVYGAYGFPCIDDFERVNEARKELLLKELDKTTFIDCSYDENGKLIYNFTEGKTKF